jgi:hypothetical protein
MITWEDGARHSADIIAKILGDPHYLFDHEPAGLAEAVRRVQPACRPSFDLYFPKTKPPVAIVFEHLREPDACRLEVRKWCQQHRIVWVPVHKRQSLRNAEFVKRLLHEWLMMALEHGTVEGHRLPGLAVPTELDALELEQEAQQLLASEIERNPALRGATRRRRLTTLRRSVQCEWLRENTRGGVRNQFEPSSTP